MAGDKLWPPTLVDRPKGASMDRLPSGVIGITYDRAYNLNANFMINDTPDEHSALFNFET